MALFFDRVSAFAAGIAGFGLAVAFVAAPSGARAQTVPGFTIEAEGQRAFGASDFEAGLVPDLFSGTIHSLKIDDGNGWGGALAVGYTWPSGLTGTVRYRRLDTDDGGGPIADGVIAFAAGDPSMPGGFIVGLSEARTEVETDSSRVDVEFGMEVALLGGTGQVFGGLTYVSIDRDSAIVDTCSCLPLLLRLSNRFQGGGPKIGFRGGVPIANAVRLVGGASVAALIGTSEFKSLYIDPLVPQGAFKDDDTRVAAALDGEAGLALALGGGTLTLGYRVDALLGALDTDQRVSEIFTGAGFPAIGDDRDNVITHGPFARFAMPLSAEN